MTISRSDVQNYINQIDAVIHDLGDQATSRNKRKFIQITPDEDKDVNHHKGTGVLSTQLSPKEASLKMRGPVGLEQQYDQLLNLLKVGLIGENEGEAIKKRNGSEQKRNGSEQKRKRNVSALLIGPRGQGKTLVLDRCLKTLENISQDYESKKSKDGREGMKRLDKKQQVPFRVVRLNGILLGGHDANVTVKEIVHQLSEIASRESFERMKDMKEPEAQKNPNKSKTNRMELLLKESHNLRMRRTTFNSSLALLDEALQAACIDSIPILIILDELDSFLINPSSQNTNTVSSHSTAERAKSQRHLLLYHLLDRVAVSNSLLSLVSSTTRLSTFGMFEKRVKSRAEGTTKTIYFGQTATYETLVDILLSKIHIYKGTHAESEVDNQNSDKERKNDQLNLEGQLREILLPSKIHYDGYGNSDERQIERDRIFMIKDIFRRNHQLGQNIRWFSRVISLSLCIFRNDFVDIFLEEFDFTLEYSKQIPQMSSKYVLEALNAMEGTNINPQIRNDLHHSKALLESGNPRIDALLDLTGSQVAVVLAAKRIISRDEHNEIDIVTKPLTFERILGEYDCYFISQSKSSGPDRYSAHVMYRSFRNLLGGLIMPAKDHTSGGPFQYFYGHKNDQDSKGLRRVPLHFNIDLEELNGALKSSLLDCTSALRDWGLSGSRS